MGENEVPLTGRQAALLARSLGLPFEEHDACGVGVVAETSGQVGRRPLLWALESLDNLIHRGAVDADGRTFDGAGVLTQLPAALFLESLRAEGRSLPLGSRLAVAMVFLPQDIAQQVVARRILEEEARSRQVQPLLWRAVPVDETVLGAKALRSMPRIEQLLLGCPGNEDEIATERRLYLVRKSAEHRAGAEGLQGFYVPSCSARTIVYKGLLGGAQLRNFYKDFEDPAYTTAIAVFHQRYSTNTFPNWILAQPFHFLGHNGEINTLQGNRNWIRAREPELSSDLWGADIGALLPIVMAGGSDSASLDNVLELLVQSGRDLLHAFTMLLPEAWERMPGMEPERRAFYDYHAGLIEPWDGPAALAFTDGVVAGATLDRNGFRPARYYLTDEGTLVVASEVGTIDLDPAHVVEKGRLAPGEMIAVDTRARRLLRDSEIKESLSSRRPYGAWLHEHRRVLLPSEPSSVNGHHDPEELMHLQQAFGYTLEDVKLILDPMAMEGKDPVLSMGDDSPLAVLSHRPQDVFNYFKQKFAQVTNPPIDPFRESLVMSLDTYMGARPSLLDESPEHARLVHLKTPLLSDSDLEALRNLGGPHFSATTLSTVFPAVQGPEGLKLAIDALCAAASAAVSHGASLLILSDRGVDAEHALIPSLLAVGAVHHHLIRQGQRMRVSLIVESGEPRDIHHFALLIGYGASSVNPYLALATLRHRADLGEVKSVDVAEAEAHFRRAVENGLLKIASKMGISTLRGYHGAQIFEAIGLSDDVVARCFAGTDSRLGGAGFAEIAGDVLAWHRTAYMGPAAGVTRRKAGLEDAGLFRYRRGGERHAFSPPQVRLLHRATREGHPEAYRQFVANIYSDRPASLRDMLAFVPGTPVPLEEVEPIEQIVHRFATSAMSIGALSPEAHKTIAIAMNRLGAKSNTGEGGEDPAWFRPFEDGDTANSAVKQVASARFGVTPEYLIRASELQIKMAQGSKPGEGGQLPGHKVAQHIARIRHATPGVELISPAPHHDIYSIEDLAQLIYDLKQANPRALVNVKLVSEAGIGTIAAGVAKAYADCIHISGHDGGTGASPLSSIKHAGIPWELGLSETQQVLVLNDLRSRVRLSVDGGFKTGRDVIKAAMLGAEEFVFGTAAMVAMGCQMARQCHLNTCPVGIATQREDLRAKFDGTPEMVVTYMLHVAEEVRELLAELGHRSLDEVVGRVDLLQSDIPLEHPRAKSLNLNAILADVDPSRLRPRKRLQPRNDRPEPEPLNATILREAWPIVEAGGRFERSYIIRNVDRTVGATLSGAIADRYTDAGLPEGSARLHFKGSAGQSFGAFGIAGVHLRLEGEANDYVGKGLGGGEVVVRPPHTLAAEGPQVIIGNTALYGATGGRLFVAGRAGERFAVRNSGATAVVEGLGHHGCEYMTGGVVVVLGSVGRNFAAGMSGGIAYVLDEADALPDLHNPDMVGLERLEDGDEAAAMRALIALHRELTDSPRAAAVLADWPRLLPRFWKVVPNPPIQAAPMDVEEEEEVAEAV